MNVPSTSVGMILPGGPRPAARLEAGRWPWRGAGWKCSGRGGQGAGELGERAEVGLEQADPRVDVVQEPGRGVVCRHVRLVPSALLVIHPGEGPAAGVLLQRSCPARPRTG